MEVFQKEYLGNVNDEVKKLFTGSGDRVIKSCREIMRQWNKKDEHNSPTAES